MNFIDSDIVPRLIFFKLLIFRQIKKEDHIQKRQNLSKMDAEPDQAKRSCLWTRIN